MRGNVPLNPEAAGSQFLRLWGGVSIPSDIIYPFMLLSLRVATVLAMTPLLYAMPVPVRIKALLVLVLSIALAANLGTTSVSNELGNLLEAAMREVALGATLALGIMLAFAAFSVAGAMLDIQIGFGIAQVYDPMSGRSSPLLVSTFNTVAVLVFFLLNGHHVLLRGLAYSVERFPVGASWAIEGTWTPILKQVSGLFTLGFALAAPVVISILMVELALGVVARNLPQINMFALGIPLKIVVGLAVLSLWASMMGGVMTRVYASIYTTWDVLFSESKGHQSLMGRIAWRRV